MGRPALLVIVRHAESIRNQIKKDTVFFADGDSPGRDLQFEDPNHEPPKVNQLLAELFDRTEDLYAQYRSSAIPAVSGPSNRRSISQFFSGTAGQLKDGDRLFIYFTGHGGRGRPERNTTLERDAPLASTVRTSS